MKATILTLAAFTLALGAQAAPRTQKEKILCRGIAGSEGVTLVLEARSNSNVEGKAIAYYASLTNKLNETTTGILFGYKEDVMLTLKPKKGDSVRVSGTIFRDEAQQNLELDLGHDDKIDLKFECEAV